MQEVQYEVLQTGKIWEVRQAGHLSAAGRHQRRADAIAHARELSREHAGEVLITTDLNTPAQSEAKFLESLWESNICPYCEKNFPAASRVGDGKKVHGGFCSLSCFASYYRNDILDRAGIRWPN